MTKHRFAQAEDQMGKKLERSGIFMKGTDSGQIETTERLIYLELG